MANQRLSFLTISMYNNVSFYHSKVCNCYNFHNDNIIHTNGKNDQSLLLMFDNTQDVHLKCKTSMKYKKNDLNLYV